MTKLVPRILIAEDSPTQQAHIVQFLTKLGYDVSAAREGKEAYDLAIAERPDILISDIVMPGMDGYELCRRLKSTPGLDQTPVILVTSLSQPQDVLAGLEAGADNFIIKPYDEQILSSRITYLLRNRSLRRIEASVDPVEVEVAGQRHQVTARKQQILDLLISTYAQAVHLFSALDQGRQELSQSYEVLQALYDLTEGLNRCRTPADVATIAVARSLGLPGVRDAWIYLREGDDLVSAAQHHAGRTRLSDPFPPALPAEPTASVDGAAEADDEPLVRDFTLPGEPARLHASMPLRIGERMMGFLHLAGAQAAISDEAALRSLAGIASQISIALERALLHTQLEEEVLKRTRRLQEEVAERRQATETITAIFNASPVGLISLDSQLKVATSNRTARDIFHTDENCVLGLAWSRLFAAPPPALEHAMADLRQGLEVTSVEVEAAIADGTPRVFHLAGEPLIDEAGVLRGAVLAVDDVTERRKVMEALHQARKMEAVGNITGGLAHDFNNLLTVIIGNLDLALLKIGSHDARAMVDVALRSSLRGAELIRKLLAFARKQPLEPKPLDVRALMSETRLLVETSLGAEVTLEVSVPDDVPNVYADQAQLGSALVNLAINARDAMPGGGRLTIGVELVAGSRGKGGRRVAFSVADTGTGIPSENMEFIFEPFFTTKTAGKGTGLGLAMVHGFANQSGGSLTVRSELGKGSCFRLVLPAVDEAETADRSVTDAAAGQADEARSVLLVEGQDEIRRTIRSTLELIGHRVHDVANAEAALAVIDEGSAFDVLLTEVGLPGGVSGFNLADLATRRRPACRILLMSGSGELMPTNERLAYRVLAKPFRSDDLKQAVAGLF
ncbi:response regulator [Xanthobacter sp. KR7-65]|uniref:response regulator n=1 Tax=Xanthobacter sp. KR7-65 TaxID=3156612 RepID=UPI0032B42D82